MANQFPTTSNQNPASGVPVDGTGAQFDPNAGGVVPQSKADQVMRAAVDSVAAVAEFPKMIYPDDKDGNPDHTKGVTVNDELDEKRQRSLWADSSGKQAAAINDEAANRRKDLARDRLKAEADATIAAAKERQAAEGKSGGSGVEDHAAAEQAAQELLAPNVTGDVTKSAASRDSTPPAATLAPRKKASSGDEA